MADAGPGTKGQGGGASQTFPVERLSPRVRDIARTLMAAGHEAWYVGGAVRDTLYQDASGRTSGRTGDVDIATSAVPDEVRALFKRTVPIGIEHGTVAVLDPDGGSHEVTTFRRDVKTDGRHAVVEFGASLDNDLARRDFTINAIAVHPDSGEMHDPFDGRADLAAGTVRAVGEPARRFMEDRLRVLRGLRFAVTFGFAIEPVTWQALRDAAEDLGHLSRERVRDEWCKMLAGATPSKAVDLWRQAGVLKRVWPELASLSADQDPWLDGVTPREPVPLTGAALAYAGAGSRAAGDAARRLRFANKDIMQIEATVDALREPHPGPADTVAVRRWVAKHRAVAVETAGALPASDTERTAFQTAVAAVLASGAALGIGELAVTGHDLQAAGIPAGPAIGDTLRRLLDVVLNDPAENTKEALLARIRS